MIFGVNCGRRKHLCAQPSGLDAKSAQYAHIRFSSEEIHSICMCTSDSVQNKVCMHFIQYAHIKISSVQKQSVHCIIHDDMQRISLTFESINKQEWKISTMTVMK